jgi:hypothetical protein
MAREVSRRQFLAGGTAAAAAAGLAMAAGPAAWAGSAPAAPAAVSGDWWKITPRSGRPWATGTTFWPASELDRYDQLVALSDGGGGGSKGDQDSRVQTWNQLAGGPPSEPDRIVAGSHLDWSSDTATNFGAQYHHLPANKAWLCWVFPTVPAGSPLTGSDTVWHRVARGQYDAHYRAMGARIRKNLDARRIDPKWFLGRPNHEMNQSNIYQVNEGTRSIYRTAMTRTIDLIREGADHPLHMAHAPALGKDIGAYLSYCPDNVDVLSISYHPSNRVTDEASWREFVYRGATDRYPVSTLFAASDTRNLPIAFLEWSPRYEDTEGCPIADQVYEWTHELFDGEKDRLVVDLVHHPNTLNTGVYQGPGGADARRAWDRGVSVYKRLWSGVKA